MRQANRDSSTKRLSSLIRDPFVRSAFERAESGDSDLFSLVATDHPPSLDSGAAELLTGQHTRRVPALVE